MDESDDLELLLGERAATRNWAAIYARLQPSLYYAAAQGARRTGVRDPDAISEAVQQAFKEFMKLNFEEVDNPRALARKIAYRRGIDEGKATRRRWNQETPVDSVPAGGLRAIPDQPDDVELSVEEEILLGERLRIQEQTFWVMKKCLGRLIDKQRHVIKEQVMKKRTLSDVGKDLGISHTAVRNHRKKALEILTDCLTEHEDEQAQEGGEGT